MAKIVHRTFSSPYDADEWLSRVSEKWNLNVMFCQVCKSWSDFTTIFYDERLDRDPKDL